ncbi:MAG: hypothetical protein RMM08_05875 [Armatimonadota bacterium]|nr:hypothetical protein [bacterium]MDW8320872.1 hypothetical protein [Armatimonadota bacterium]
MKGQPEQSVAPFLAAAGVTVAFAAVPFALGQLLQFFAPSVAAAVFAVLDE